MPYSKLLLIENVFLIIKYMFEYINKPRVITHVTRDSLT
ncbi:hypothetical protein MAR_036013 [Mya arenaria]|uniref:Uncharacterized protein n=1 Tax=Mya arenaria TaxID=6604 RepID=A0ABY7EPE3_MYAAR|nr:hypothetical protein MAR_036013 [Mya arenaria]